MHSPQRSTQSMLPCKRAALLYLAILCSVLAAGCASRQPVPSQPAQTFSEAGYAIVQTARTAIGAPYVWGGQGPPPKGFDCSGLIKWTYGRHGINVPRPSWEQINTGQLVSYTDRTYGDLIFFKTEGKGFHVGIVSGPQSFIHSPSRGKRVRESAISQYWAKRFVAVKRIVR